MRLFSFTSDGRINPYRLIISPRCQGPAVIKDFILSAPNEVFAPSAYMKIFISDDNAGGNADSATELNPTGEKIWEQFLFNYAGTMPAVAPVFKGHQSVYTAAGEHTMGPIIPLDYPVNKTSFFIKVYMFGSQQNYEGQLRVLEGVDLTRFF